MVNQVVLLAGGKGTRMRELTETIPKPMVKIGELPVLEHLINVFETFKNFSYLVATGYKKEFIDDHFKDFDNVKTIFTGDETNTGGRVYKLKDKLEDVFIVTYGLYQDLVWLSLMEITLSNNLLRSQNSKVL